MKEIFVIRFGQEYFGFMNKQVGFFRLHSPNVSRFTTYQDAEAALQNLRFPDHCVGEFFQILKFFVYTREKDSSNG